MKFTTFATTFAATLLTTITFSHAQIESWQAGPNETDFGNPANWTNQVPDSDKIAAIGGSVAAENSEVVLDQDRSLGALLISDGMSLANDNHILEVLNLNNGGLSVAGANMVDDELRRSTLSVSGSLQNCADFYVLGEGRFLSGGLLQMSDASVSFETLTIDSESLATGSGLNSIFAEILNNNGTLQTNFNSRLRIRDFFEDTEYIFDLDGSEDIGNLDASAPFSIFEFEGEDLTDPFDGEIRIGNESVFRATAIGNNFEIGTGQIIFNGEEEPAEFQTNGILDSGSTVASILADGDGRFVGTNSLSMGGAFNIVLTDGSNLEFDEMDSLLTGQWNIGQGATLDFANSDMFAIDTTVVLNGGEVISNADSNFLNNAEAGLRGHGYFNLDIQNDSVIAAEGGTLIIDGSENENGNDWDGINNTGQLLAEDGDLRIIESGGFPGIQGEVRVSNGHVFEADSTSPQFGGSVYLDEGTISGSLHMFFTGNFEVANESTLSIGNFISFQEDVHVQLQGDLNLQGNDTIITAASNFSGTGSLVNDADVLIIQNGAVLNVDLVNNSNFQNSAGDAVETVSILGNVENTGTIHIGLGGTTFGTHDRTIVSEDFVSNDSTISVSIHNGFQPGPGDEFDVLDFGSFVDNGITFDLATLWPGLEWDTSDFTTEGVLRIGGFLLGDVNQDGSVNLLDVDPFVDLLTGGEYLAEADINQDGAVDLLDVALFVELITEGY